MAKALVIFLHGVGSNGDDLAVLGQHWSSLLPDVAFASPNAPFPFEHAMGYQWFSLTGITTENRPARVREARAAFDATLQQLMAQHGMADAWDKVILVGFSQGSIMALDALASGRYPLAGVVAFSGRLSFDGTLTPQAHTPALLIHGKADGVIPYSETESAAQRLQAAGLAVEARYEATTGHTLSSQGAMQAATFIAQCLQD
ncbi:MULTISPECIES: alpha/beta hydrolase [Pantoea]|uniref:Phospholipase n=2 Tax=Pantoea TaxID=53335 RepID=A0A0U3JTW5_9GAMM|nr:MULTISPECIES: dienelactone hydrolase family protein [Pantoea]ALV90652.1 phospholipase [Pantoea vagans]KHJ67019.1 phospholipase [Pantoea rodasii]